MSRDPCGSLQEQAEARTQTAVCAKEFRFYPNSKRAATKEFSAGVLCSDVLFGEMTAAGNVEAALRAAGMEWGGGNPM